MYIDIKDYTKQIKGVQVLNNINLHMESGRVYGLKGKNGCGKTMLMRAVSGLMLPTSGHVDIDGKLIGRDIRYPESIGVLIENPAFLPGETGFSNLKILASLTGRATDEQIKRTIADVGLDPEDKRKYRKYSPGMKQRLGIASALMERPDIIILDEPTNALDKNGALLLRELVDREKKRGALIILSCHDEEEMALLADIVVHMGEGRIEEVEELEKDV